MIPRKMIAAPRLFVVFALALLPGLCFGRAEPFVRPVVQYTWLPSFAREATEHTTLSFGGGGVAPSGPQATVSNYVTDSSGFGGGLSVGVAVGKENQIEIGVEGTLTRFSGTYQIIPHDYYIYSSGQAVRVEAGPTTTHSCTITARTILSTFRQYFGKKSARVRPYWALWLGGIDAEFTGVNLPPGVSYDDKRDSGYSFATGLSVGALIRLGNKTYLEAGYRFLYSDQVKSDGLYSNSHTLNLALNQRF